MKVLRTLLMSTVCVTFAGFCVALLGQDQGKDKAASATPSEELVPEEKLILSLNIVRDAKVAAGEPILIEVAVAAGRGEKGPVESVLSNPEGSWGDLVSIGVFDSNGKPVPGLSIKALAKGGPSIALGRKQSGWLAWAIEPVSGKTLAPGEYTVRAVLDKTRGDDPNEKKVRSAPSQLSVVAAAQLPEDNERWASLAKTWILIYRSELDQALAAAETSSTADPEGWVFLDLKGDVLVRMGRHAEAVRAYDLALRKIKPLSPDAVPEPPIELIKKRERAAAAAKTGG